MVISIPVSVFGNPMERASGFSLYVRKLIDFSRQNPWTFRIILLNLCAETVETVPGKTRFINAVESIREQLIQMIAFKASHEELWRFTDSFNALLFYYLGTPERSSKDQQKAPLPCRSQGLFPHRGRKSACRCAAPVAVT
jgi:hypothetical protein